MSGPVSMGRFALVLGLLVVGCTCGQAPAVADAGTVPIAAPDAGLLADGSPAIREAARPPVPEGFVDTDVDNHVIGRLLGGGSGDTDLSAGDVESAAGLTPTNVNAQAAAFEAELKAELAKLKAEVLPEIPTPAPPPAPPLQQVPVDAGTPSPDAGPMPPPVP